MKKIKAEIVEKSRRYWTRSVLTSFLTFLSSKLAGINTANAVHVGQQEDENFIEKFLIENEHYYNPCSNKYPKNPEEWFRTIWQYRYKPEMPFSQAFNRPTSGSYTFSHDYIELTKKHTLKGKRILLSHILIWLYRNTSYNENEELIDLKRQFIPEFNITEEELGSLFDDDIAGFPKIFDVKTIQEEKIISYPETPITINEPLEPALPGVGAGFGNTEMNREVEKAAISHVTKWYVSRGWDVQSVEAEKTGYDLLCKKETAEEHVEVKGARGTEVSFIITAGEVRQARGNHRFKLCVVTSALSDKPMLSPFTGQEFVDKFKLEVLAFRASLRVNERGHR